MIDRKYEADEHPETIAVRKRVRIEMALKYAIPLAQLERILDIQDEKHQVVLRDL